MPMPNELVLVRHGQSEANIVQKQFKTNPDAVAPDGFHDRHDSRMRLSDQGREQACLTGDWLRDEFPDGFDRYYTSSLVRTVETAGCLALGGNWHIDDRWRERDWGEYGVVTEQEPQFALSRKIRDQSKWYWCPPGGESLATGVSLRFKDILGTLHREMPEKRVIAVTHGETIQVARVILERLLPEQWHAQEEDPAFDVANCQVLQYSRTDPISGEVGKHLSWRRSVCAWDDSRSWQSGEWVKIERQTYDDAALLNLVDSFPNLLD